MFRQVTDQPATVAAAGRVPQQRSITAGLPDDPQQDFDERCLSRSVGTEQTKRFAFVDLKRYPFERFEPFPENGAFGVRLAKRIGLYR